jgi:hypothetical protein
LRKLARRNRPALLAASAIAAILITGTVVSTRQAIRATRAERQITRQRDQADALRVREEERRKLAEAINLAAQLRLGEADSLVANVPVAFIGPEHAPVFRQLSNWHALQGRLRRAADCRWRILALDPDDAERSKNYLMLGTLLVERHDSSYEQVRHDAVANFG